MKALLLTEPLKLGVTELPLPEPKPGEALIKVKYAGICGSDISAYLGHHPWCEPPIVLGHEAVGEVVEVNGVTTRVKAGDLVAIDPVVECGHCYPCRVGRYNCCSNMKILGIDFNGGFAEYLAMPVHRLHLVPKGMAPERAVLTEPLSIGAQASYRAQLEQGDSVVVLGGGPIGLCTLLMAKATADVKVTVVDVLGSRLELARSLGADQVLDATKDDVVGAVMEDTQGEGAPVVIEATGRPQSMSQALEMISAGGRIVVLGLTREQTPFVPAQLVKKEMAIIASRLNTQQFPKVLQTLADPHFPAESLVTQRGTLAESAGLLQFTAEKPQECMKAIIAC